MFTSTTTLLGLVFFGFIALIVMLRLVRRSLRRRADRPLNVDFSVAELHEMQRKGMLTAEEFERLKQSVLTRAPSQPHAGRAPGFQVIQNPPPLPPDDSSREAR